ncbi:unnamed protein product [Pleuronectes platessa]|uniref:Uncharacterized protein n=1 Tax=Pleuronectes platessa TaxID=8262 RepID=A0A9N7Z9F4_PLEPL|nr:unnamed protein product [Pleuronectes platessa]
MRTDCEISSVPHSPPDPSLQADGPLGSIGGIPRSKHHKPTDPYSRSKTNRWDTAVIRAGVPLLFSLSIAHDDMLGTSELASAMPVKCLPKQGRAFVPRLPCPVPSSTLLWPNLQTLCPQSK